jgi:putative chitinase
VLEEVEEAQEPYVTPDLLRAATGCTADRAAAFAAPLAEACERFGIAAGEPLAMFLANVAHESGALKWLTELWGPTEAQKTYEGRKTLGNTRPGDGARYRGRGLLQTTGRANYRELRPALLLAGYPDVPDFEAEPERLAEPRWAAASAGHYWHSRGLSAWAEAGDFLAVCRGINVGNPRSRVTPNGMADREARLRRARAALAFSQNSAPAQAEPPASPAPAPTGYMRAGEGSPQEPEMPLAPIVAAVLPSIIESIPKLGKLFGSGSEVAERNVKAAEMAVGIVKDAVGAVNAQDAAEKLKADPSLVLAAVEAIDANWYALAEAGGGGIDGARKADAAIRTAGDLLHSASFWIAFALLPLVYLLVLSLIGMVGSAQWSDDVRAGLAGSLISAIIGGLVGYYYGQTTTRNRSGGAS